MEMRLTAEKGFDGTIKELWEDFHVREIKPSGEICQLSQLLTRQDIESDRVQQLTRSSGKGESALDLHFL